jgi:hypothetical protein
MTTISLSTAAVSRSFQNLLSAALNQNTSLDIGALEDEFGRFRVWAGNLGALQKGHSSADYRLRDSPLLLSNALKLLKELDGNLTESIAVVLGNRLPYEQQAQTTDPEDEDQDSLYSEDEDDEEDTDAPKTELQQRFQDIVDIVDHLYKLSVRIRQPTLRARSLKAASYQPKDPETGVDLLDQYATFDLQHAREIVAHLRADHNKDTNVENDILVQRLGKAITLRRRQFKYWRRRTESPHPRFQSLTDEQIEINSDNHLSLTTRHMRPHW